MRRRLIQPLLVATISLGVASGLASCGVTGGSGDAIEALALPRGATSLFAKEAGAKTAAVTSEKVAVTLEVLDAAGDPTMKVTSKGAFDAEAKVGHLTTSVDAGASGLPGADLSTEIVYDGDTVYVKAGVLDFLTDGKPWIKVTSARLADVVGKLDGSVQSDPGAFLDLLEGAGGPLEDLGTENVRGVPTRHVGVTLDIEKLLDQVDPARAATLRAQLDRMPGVREDLSNVPAEAWIDTAGYVRRFAVTLGLDGGEKGSKGKVVQTIELYDFDEPVDVAVPPADQVAEFDPSALFGD